MKKKVVKYSLLALLIILAAFSQTLSMKADIGVCACWDSVSMNVSPCRVHFKLSA